MTRYSNILISMPRNFQWNLVYIRVRENQLGLATETIYLSPGELKILLTQYLYRYRSPKYDLTLLQLDT